MKIRLISNNLKSKSLKRLSKYLTNQLKYKVWRSSNTKQNRNNLLYGHQLSKTEQYKWFQEQDINALEFTESYNDAKEWAFEGTAVVARLLTRASEGRGIIISEEAGQIPMAPLYTKYKKKKKEFRIHIFKDKVVHVLEKRKRRGGICDAKIRNTINGYVFCSENVEEPKGLRELALKASKVTKSDFKGVDIGWNEKKNELFVIEVNSAPGIEGNNLNRYVTEIINYDYNSK